MRTLLPFLSVFLPMLCSPLPTLLGGARDSVKRDKSTIVITFVTFACAVLTVVTHSQVAIDGFCGSGALFAAPGLQGVLLILCGLCFTLSALASPAYFLGEENVGRYQAFFLVTFGALNGVFLSRDLFTTYLFFEMMSLSSWVWVAQNETEESRRAADTYLAIAIMGGLAMLYGLFFLQHRYGTLAFDALASFHGAGAFEPGVRVAGFCLLAGFGAKAGMFPLHVWLPKAHPVAPAPASALLSGILTKAGVFGILLLSAGLYRGDHTFALTVLILGSVTMVLGALLALVTNDLKRALACSSLSQIGFILISAALVGLGQEVDYAAGGAVLHMINHGLIKAVLFIAAGAIYKANHTLDLNRLRGAGRGSLLLTVCFALGGLAITGFPLLGGYVSKTLIHEAIVENAGVGAVNLTVLMKVIEWLFLISGGLTLAYMLKLFIRLFVEKGDCPPVHLDSGTGIAMGIPAGILVICGLLPKLTYEPITNAASQWLSAQPVDVRYFSLSNLSGAGVSIGIGLIVYGLVVRFLLTDRRTGLYKSVHGSVSLEDTVYRPLLRVLAWVGALVCRFAYSLTDWFILLVDKGIHFAAPMRFQPGKDDHFAHYSRKYVRQGKIVQTLAFELLLFGIGVVVILLYLLF
jgi:formate hydrogenlyase subunit 3/multisubunit Na+/H+ antiporter MnhD subunit